MRRNRRSRAQGFTLTEILVAMTILSVIVVMLFSIFDHATRAWQASEKNVDAFREARAALFMLKGDLGRLLASSKMPVIFNQVGTGIHFSGNALAPATDADNVFFQALEPQTQSGAGQCGIGYYVAYSINMANMAAGSNLAAKQGKGSFNLFRCFRESGANVPSLFSFFQAIHSDESLIEANLNTLYPGANANPTGDEVVARNVTRFRLRPYWRDTAGTLVSVSPNGNASILSDTPAFIEIELKVINYSTAAQLNDEKADWSSSTASEPARRLLERSEQTFVTRLNIAGTAPVAVATR
jgi:prepilin-type N-terminal cleavage/methylation domain-containing protein